MHQAAWLCPCLLLCVSQATLAADEAAPTASAERVEPEQASLRERLLEREDRRRPFEPAAIDVAGRPLTVGGEYELALDVIKRQVVGEVVEEPDGVLLAQGIELEAFYSIGPVLSAFVQARFAMEEELLPNTVDDVSDLYVERGEMWIASERVGGTPLSLELGRLDFEDDRRWWWDEELDAVRASYETANFDVSLALAYELFPARSDQDRVGPRDDDVLRVIGEASWTFRPDHALELFLLHGDDSSPTEGLGELFRTEHSDDSDARLTWLGARLLGAFELGAPGVLGYWLDGAVVGGTERSLTSEEISDQSSVVTEHRPRRVRGWALDVGANWLLPLPYEPRLFAGFAYASGDSDPSGRTDRSFRQPGIQANEAGFGGVQRFGHYGVLLDPELSNLAVLTVGTGISLLRSSSLDLVYHYDRLVERADFLRDALLDLTLTGRSRDLGQEIDLVLAVEEWERFEFEVAVGAFRAGDALGPDEGTWSIGSFLAMRVVF